MNNRILLLIGLLILQLALSCKKESEPTGSTEKFTDGVFISNEGKFPDGSGTITFLKRDGSAIYQDVYQQANNMKPLGSVVQFMKIIGNVGFIAVNNANKIEIVDAESCVSTGTIENIATPATIFKATDSKIYVSSWDNVVYSIRSDGSEIFGQISVGTGPTRMAGVGGNVWVLNQGGFGVDSTVSVIDPAIDQVIKTIDLYPLPSGIATDQDGTAWVLCKGRYSYQGTPTSGHLLAIDPVDYSIQKDLIFQDTVNHPEFLVMDYSGKYLFYNYLGGIYRYEIGKDQLANSPFIPYAGYLYSLAYDLKADVLYTSDPVDFVQRGWIFRYDAASGVMIDSVKAGVVPRDFEFVD